jgi:hypothetical protein
LPLTSGPRSSLRWTAATVAAATVFLLLGMRAAAPAAAQQLCRRTDSGRVPSLHISLVVVRDVPCTMVMLVGMPESFRVITPSNHGSVSVNNRVALYTPNPGYTGPDSYTVRAVYNPDGRQTTAEAFWMVTITVVPPS